MSKTATTIHEELVDELNLLVEGLKDSTERGTGPREYLNGLLRDAYVIERSAREHEDAEDAAWLAPFLDALLAKLELGSSVIPAAAKQLQGVVGRVAELQQRNELLARLREEVPPLLADRDVLRAEARAELERGNVVAALQSRRLLRGAGVGPAEIQLAGRLLEGLGLHLALNQAEGTQGPRDADLTGLANRLEGWLTDRGAQPERPAVGAQPTDARVVQGTRRATGVRAGCVAQLVTPGFTLGGERCARPVVVASAGAEAQVLSAARELLQDVTPETVQRILPYLEAVGAALTTRMEDPQATRQSRAEAALDVVGAVLPALEGTGPVTRLLKALTEDFPGADVELLLPTAGSPFAVGVGWESRDLFVTDDTPPGTIVKLLRPGMKIAGELVRPALVQVSQGSPPPGTIDEVLELLPADDPRSQHLIERLTRARCLAAGDAGAQLARELADLALFIRDDLLAEPARRALRLVLDEPPQALVGTPGWEAIREFLDANLESLYEDGENGEIVAHRLTRPFLQGLRTHEMTGAQLRALGESMNAMLSLYDEALAATSRAWLFSELERLAGGEGLPRGGHARRLLRTAAKAVGAFYKNGETTPAMELTQALGRAGVKVFPEDEVRLERCPQPETTFHRLEAVYDEQSRFKLVGVFEPAASLATDAQVAETGAITLSLGPERPLVAWLRSDVLRGSRLGAAATRLVEELTALDRRRLIAELKGDAGAERAFSIAAAERIVSALAESGWQRGSDEREALGELFRILEQQHHVTLLPGYLPYRRLRALQDDHGPEQVKVEIVREGPKQITLSRLGIIYRDELVAPLDMAWGVGKPPAYVQHLRDALPWFDEVLSGSAPSIKLSPGAVEAIKDFESPDAGSLEGVVSALRTIATWLAQEVADELPRFTKEVKNAPGLELDFFPLPGQTYDTKRLLAALDQARTPDALSVVRDQAREDGEAIHVEQIAVYKGSNLISEEPRARFALKKLPRAAEDLQRALEPILVSANVLGTTKAILKGLITRLSLIPEGEGQQGVELNAFRALLDAKLIDPSYVADPENALHKGGAYLVGRLEAAGLLKVERFQGATKIEDALKGYSADAAEIDDVFCLVGSPELAEIRRPLVMLEGKIIQKAALMRGVPTSDAEVLEFDKVLVDTVDRLQTWVEGTGALAEPLLGKTEQQIVPRTIKRITDVRKKMFQAQSKKQAVLPPETARRDLIKLIIDQVHRAEDSLAILEDQIYRGAFGDLVFRDVVFRSNGPYLSKQFRIAIDTDVVAGADTQALVGRFKKESTGPKPKRENAKIWSVVIPCYSQDGVTIRPATVRVGDF